MLRRYSASMPLSFLVGRSPRTAADAPVGLLAPYTLHGA